MFAFLRGRLVSATPTACVIDAGGVGYRLFISAALFSQLPSFGEELLLHCSLVVRELSQALYGFLTIQERDVFELLLGISGVGPKLSLSIIGHLSLADLQQAIQANDSRTLSKIPGIGKKTAERLIIEMRDKLDSLIFTAPNSSLLSQNSQIAKDAINALVHLGYAKSTAEKAVKRSQEIMPDASDLALLITEALKNV